MSNPELDLSGVKLFEGLPTEALALVHQQASHHRFADGQVIMLEGDRNPHVFFVRNGHVRVYRSCAEGREQTMINIGPGAAFNLPCAFGSCHNVPANAVAVGDVDIVAIERRVFRELTITTPSLAAAVLSDLSDKLRHVGCLARDLSLRSVRGRLAQLMLDESNREGKETIRWTQEQIATQIGSVREVVGRVLRGFIREGLISMKRQRIIVLDREGLRKELE